MLALELVWEVYSPSLPNNELQVLGRDRTSGERTISATIRVFTEKTLPVNTKPQSHSGWQPKIKFKILSLMKVN